KFKMKNAKLRKSYRSLFAVHSSLPKGFTLLEIMIALAIVGAVVITILYTVNYHADTAYEHTVTTRMFLAAKEKIAEMEQNPQDAKGNIAGTDYTYKNSVNTTKDEGIIEIKTIINKNGKKVILSELVIKKEIQNPQ
ncbi:MAG: prepilin-type N-terminal cleavage/methylation domain-containing protein, partial [Thermodesulfovibrionia bacterium]|nr:prepilin-type N-terminal cleavage/methylation domain-containing protein [Thermodesulfovibrionia bacterium]